MDQPEFRLREIWPPGTVIKDDYIIERRLGSGGFGTVYLARHRFLQSQHVIKRLHEQLASDESTVRKFIREGQSIRKLSGCPYIVDIEHMTQAADGHLILIMEYVPGGDLEGYLKTKGRLEIAEALDLAAQIAEGLKAAHAVGLLHRDIKPQNVLLARRPDGSLQAKLIDFGIAANQETQQSSALRGGSLGYAAPEQWMMSGKNLDARGDLYSLGAALYRMLTGRMPYNAEDIGDWMAQARSPPPRPATLVANVPPDLDRLLLEQFLGEGQVKKLVNEHDGVFRSMRRIAQLAEKDTWSDTGRGSAMATLELIYEHPISCDGLTLWMERLTEAEQDALLQKMQEARQQGTRFSAYYLERHQA